MIGIRREDIIRYAGMLRAAGAKNVLVSMGADGAILVADDGNVYEEPVPPMEDSRISSTIGAGDSLVAGFTAEYFCGSGDYGASLSKGVYAGTLTATGRGI
jgi:1-phosphofructokinase